MLRTDTVSQWYGLGYSYKTRIMYQRKYMYTNKFVILFLSCKISHNMLCVEELNYGFSLFLSYVMLCMHIATRIWWMSWGRIPFLLLCVGSLQMLHKIRYNYTSTAVSRNYLSHVKLATGCVHWGAIQFHVGMIVAARTHNKDLLWLPSHVKLTTWMYALGSDTISRRSTRWLTII